MHPTKNAEAFVRKQRPNLKTEAQLDRRILDDAFSAMDEALDTRKPSIAAKRVYLKPLRLAAVAAVVLVAFFLFFAGPETQESQDTDIVYLEKSPTKMLSMISLRMAYRQGGIEAVDHQSDQAFKLLGSQSNGVSLQELFAEL